MSGRTDVPSRPCVAPAAVAETHCAVVLFVGDRAYKVKKPLDLGFADFTDREVRRRVLLRELELNRRLAPDVYLAVAELVETPGTPGEPVLVMRRLPAQRALSRMVQSRAAGLEEAVRDVARVVAAFHGRTTTSRSVVAHGTREAVRRLWEDGLGQQARFAAVVDADVLDRTGLLARRYLAGRQALFDERIRDGCVRDGHGDLLAADVYLLDDGPRVLDCIEFDDRLRHGDVLLDAAFLAMDLEWLGRPDLARLFLATWAELTGDSHAPSLAEHYVAYRASVRSKVACLRAEQGDPHAGDEARGLAALALDHLERARVRLVLVGGLPGTGKSTLAAGVTDADGWLLVRSDVVRKAAAGLRPEERAAADPDEGLYTPERTEAVYAELLARAEVALVRGVSVVLDAGWGAERWRRQARDVAARTAADLVELECTVPAEVAAARVAARVARGDDASDADVHVAQLLAQRAEPWPAAVRLCTDADSGVVLEAALALVGPQ